MRAQCQKSPGKGLHQKNLIRLSNARHSSTESRICIPGGSVSRSNNQVSSTGLELIERFWLVRRARSRFRTHFRARFCSTPIQWYLCGVKQRPLADAEPCGAAVGRYMEENEHRSSENRTDRSMVKRIDTSRVHRNDACRSQLHVVIRLGVLGSFNRYPDPAASQHTACPSVSHSPYSPHSSACRVKVYPCFRLPAMPSAHLNLPVICPPGPPNHRPLSRHPAPRSPRLGGPRGSS